MRFPNSCLALAAFFAMVAHPASAAPPTDAQKCESTFELVGKVRPVPAHGGVEVHQGARRREAERGARQVLDEARRRAGKAVTRYGASCTSETPSGFDAYLTQCSNDVEAASEIGGSLPDHVGDLAVCDASLASGPSPATSPIRNGRCSVGIRAQHASAVLDLPRWGARRTTEIQILTIVREILSSIAAVPLRERSHLG